MTAGACWDTEPSWEQRVDHNAHEEPAGIVALDWKQNGKSCLRLPFVTDELLCCKAYMLTYCLEVIGTAPAPPKNLAAWLYSCNVNTVMFPLQDTSRKDSDRTNSLAPDSVACELPD